MSIEISSLKELVARSPRAKLTMQRDHFHVLVGVELRKRRIASGMTQAELAKVSGVPRTSIHAAEIGLNCTFHAAAKLAEAFDCMIDELVPLDAT